MTMIDVTTDTFETEVVARSLEVPVVVDFWAAWCGPCRALGPVLERLAEEADGAWALAKVDVDANQQLASTFGVQGIPAVMGFKDGEIVAEFTGALPEADVRRWLELLGPGPADLACEEGARLEAAGDLAGAAVAYRAALADAPAHKEAARGLHRVEVALRAGPGAGADDDLRRRADAGDLDATFSLADTLALRDEFGEAFGRLVEAVRRTSGDERDHARSRLVAMFDLAPEGDPRVAAARRALTNALY